MITTTMFDLTLAAIALTGYGAILGFWGGFKYGRARAALRDKARHARIGAAFAFSLKHSAEVNNSILGVLQQQQVRALQPPTVDWNLLVAAANGAGYVLVKPELLQPAGTITH